MSVIKANKHQIGNNIILTSSGGDLIVNQGVHDNALTEIARFKSDGLQGSDVSYVPAGTGVVATNVQAKLREFVSVKDFGAVGDGLTNDTEAFQKAAAFINAQGGGKIVIPPGTYIVGKQDFAGRMGLEYAYRPQSILRIQNCTKPVVVEGHGAVLKAANGLRIGSFDPVTGAVHNPTMPFTNPNYQASPYWGMIELLNNTGGVEVRGLELDGNIANLVLGGLWGDRGRQCAAAGIRAYGNSRLIVENVYTHHHGLDGIIIGYPGLTETSPQYPHTLINVVSEYNARQGLSWVGGNSLTAIGCSFSKTGRAVFVSAPGAGVDLEAELSICRNGTFINCQFIDNVGAGIVAESGDVRKASFYSCLVVGATTWATWLRKPEITLTDCKIIGASVNPFSSSNPEEATKYIRCSFIRDKAVAAAYGETVMFPGSLALDFPSANNVLLDTCHIKSTAKLCDIRGSFKMRNCTLEAIGPAESRRNRDWIAVLWGGAGGHKPTLENNTIIGNMSGTLDDALYVELHATPNAFGNNLINLNGSALIRWNSWSTGAGGFDGPLGTTLPLNYSAMAYLPLHIDGWATLYGGYRKIALGSAPPTTGEWQKGDRVLNQNPSVGQPKGWICTVSGSPGTWVSEGDL